MLTPSGSAKDCINGNDSAFRVCFNDPGQGMQYMQLFFLNATVSLSVIALLAAGATLPIFVFNRRAFSLKRRRKNVKETCRMETFWNTIASYNAATWPAQLALTLAAVVLTLLLYFRPSPAVRIAMKVFMALLNFWIAGVYYLVCCEPREHHDLLALFWAIMGCIWVYDLAVGHASLQRTGNHKAFAALLFAMPLVYPLFSLLLGRTFPMITSPVMPCSVAVFTIGGLPAGMQHRPGAVPLLPRIHPRQRRAAHETLAAGAQRAARGDVPDHRVLLRLHAAAPAQSLHRLLTRRTHAKKSARPTGRFFFLRQTPPIRCGAGPTCCWRR